MDIIEAIEGRRSVRKFQDKKIPEETIKRIVEAGMMAPSGTNIQPWYFVAVASPDELASLRDIASRGAEGFRPRLEERFKEHPEVIKQTTSFVGTFGYAPLVVLAFVRSPEVKDGRDTVIQSIAAAIENMTLAAYGEGIGSCWMTALISGGVKEDIRARYAPERGELIATVAFGYPEIIPKMPKRKDDRVKYIL